jgi:hypothetical protein
LLAGAEGLGLKCLIPGWREEHAALKYGQKRELIGDDIPARQPGQEMDPSASSMQGLDEPVAVGKDLRLIPR